MKQGLYVLWIWASLTPCCDLKQTLWWCFVIVRKISSIATKSRSNNEHYYKVYITIGYDWSNLKYYFIIISAWVNWGSIGTWKMHHSASILYVKLIYDCLFSIIAYEIAVNSFLAILKWLLNKYINWDILVRVPSWQMPVSCLWRRIGQQRTIYSGEFNRIIYLCFKLPKEDIYKYTKQFPDGPYIDDFLVLSETAN